MDVAKKVFLGILLIAFCDNSFSQKVNKLFLLDSSFKEKGNEVSIPDSFSSKKGEHDFVSCGRVELNPKYPGGPKALEAVLNKKMLYPTGALENNYGGKVTIQFIISKDGTILEPKILQGACLYYGLGEEALKLVSNMPKWQPGEQNGRRVTYRYFIDMMFSAQNQIPSLAIKLNLKYNGQYGNPDSSCNKILFW